jgi:hypothetical protein
LREVLGISGIVGARPDISIDLVAIAEVQRREGLPVGASGLDPRRFLTPRITGTADVWFQTDANGTPTLSVQALTLRKPSVGTAAAPALHSRFIQLGSQVLAYNPELRGDNTILLASRTQTRSYPSWAVPSDAFDGRAWRSR